MSHTDVVPMHDMRDRIQRKRQHQRGESNSQPLRRISRYTQQAHRTLCYRQEDEPKGYVQWYGDVKRCRSVNYATAVPRLACWSKFGP